jgi:tRNA pseudouridine55 synthase
MPGDERPRDYVLLYDKPAGVTSHDVVATVRRGLPRKTKVGHAGTLDPFATGLLLVLIGRATRVQRFLMALPKRYETIARFGAVSSTGDPDGDITETGRLPAEDLELPVGVIRQRPPAYSAVKVGGRRAYELARAGESVDLAEREVTVYRFEQSWHEADRRAFVIECSSGTYVRTLISELGDAYCQALRRTRIGRFDVADADPERPIAVSNALDFMPEVRLDAEAARRAAFGQAVEGGTWGVGVTAGGRPDSARAPTVRLTDAEGLIALAQPTEDGAALRAVVGFR